MRIRSIEPLPATPNSSAFAWGNWAVKDYQSIWLTMHRFVLLNGPSKDAFINDLCGAVRMDLLKKRPWLVVPGDYEINLMSVAKLCGKPVDYFRLSHMYALPQRRALFHHHLRFCRSCLKAGYHTTLMSLQALNHCPIHGDGLEDRCKCGKPYKDGVSGKIIPHPGQCPCGEQELLTLDAARSPSIAEDEVLLYKDLATWLLKCGTRIFLNDDNGFPTDTAVTYWANVFRTVVPYEYSCWNYSNQGIQVNVHMSSKTIAPVRKNDSAGKYPEHNLRTHWQHQRNLLSKAYANSVYTTYCAICRYIRRHILPSAKRLELDPKWHVYTHGSTQYTIPSRLVKAYVFFQMYGGHSNYARVLSGGNWEKPQPNPESVSPFAFDSGLSSAPWPLQHPEGARWLHDRAEADYLWVAWKRCVACAKESNGNDIAFLWKNPVKEDCITHWSAGFKNGRYILRIEAVRYPKVPVRRRITKLQRRERLAAAAVKAYEKTVSELSAFCLRFSGAKGWDVGRGTLPAIRPEGKWFKKKELFLKQAPGQVHYVIFPYEGQYVARTFENPVEVMAATSQEALSLLKVGVERTHKLNALHPRSELL